MPLPAPITSRTNARVKALRAAFSGDAARPGDLLGIEGEHLLSEAHRSNLPIDTIFLREGNEPVLDRPSLAGLTANHTVVLSRDVFASTVDTASPQGIAATLLVPPIAPRDLTQPFIHLVLESLQDPGNLGTLIRSAEAFGIAQIFLTPDCVNPWNPKTVRASAGSVFRMPIVRDKLSSIATAFSTAQIKLFAAVAQSTDATPAMDVRLIAPCALMIGNEGAGLSAEALALANTRIHIPCAVESLNAAIAGSLLMYEALRQNTLAGSLYPLSSVLDPLSS
ncbi:RNA methyltransferase [Granulicella sp. 5B5]|uniref:TrmH family RNA methyltransferase n=1 Tax=Granulicella sp. 5B5 TaxID=1617967 RepID=UPI0021039F7F|nr:RNA methyltransferase [Granulicella sp. 5B5]